MKAPLFILLTTFNVCLMAQLAQPDIEATERGELTIQPVLHGTLALQWSQLTIFFDPYGGGEVFTGLNDPDLIFITDIHGDHLDIKTLDELNTSKATFIAPQAVADQLPEKYLDRLLVINNGEIRKIRDISVTAVPMYNLPESDDSRHTKGRGNGYVLEMGGKSLYVSGDTEDIPEMRALENIDIAFVCMNLPYTMDIDQAASAVLDFKPEIVYPFHYRGQGGLNDVASFKSIVTKADPEIEVRLRNWYPNSD